VGARLGQLGVTVLSLVVLALGWEAGVRVLGVPVYLVPPPSRVVQDLVARNWMFAPHVSATFQETALGFAAGIVGGITAATLIVASPFLQRVLYPLLVIAQIVPKIAIAPIILIWVGHGIVSKILIAFLVSFFPLVVNTITGLRAVETDLLDLMRSLGAGASQTFVKVRFPNALPFIFSGLKVSIVLSVVGAIVGEFVGGSEGLGYLILVSNSEMNTPLMFSAFFLLSVLGLLLFGAVALAERLVAPWAVADQEDPTRIVGA
jgi:NitT/TauT family transport system permease protein